MALCALVLTFVLTIHSATGNYLGTAFTTPELSSSNRRLHQAPFGNSLCPSTAFNHQVGEQVVSPGIFYNPDNTPGLGGCIPQYLQQAEPTGHRYALNQDVFTPAFGGNTVSDSNITACIQSCPDGVCCIVQFEREPGPTSEGGTCKQAVLPLADSVPAGGDDTPRLFFKMAPANAGEMPNTPGKRRLQTMSSTLYARCSMKSWEDMAARGEIGTSPNSLLVEMPKNKIDWNSEGCTSESTCQATCDALSSCFGFMYVPKYGYALRAGEFQLGVRSFFVSPASETFTFLRHNQCPPYTLYQPANVECMVKPTVKACCIATCGNTAVTTVPQPFTCPGGILDNKTISTQIVISAATCCEPTCGSTVVTSDVPVPYQGCVFPAEYDEVHANNKPPGPTTCCDVTAFSSSDVSVKAIPVGTVAVGESFDVQSILQVESLGTKGVKRVTAFYQVPDSGLVIEKTPSGRNCSIQKESTLAFCELGNLRPADGAVTLTFTLKAKLAGYYSAVARVAGMGDVVDGNDKDTVRIRVMGACCQHNTTTCTPAASAAECTADAFAPDQSCATATCKPPTPLGACCSINAECTAALTQADCPAGSLHFADITCDSAVCLSPPAEDMCGWVTPVLPEYTYDEYGNVLDPPVNPETPVDDQSQLGPTRFSCPEGLVFNEAALKAHPAAADVCCLATCGNADVWNTKPTPFACPDGYNFLRRNVNKTNPSVETCCARRLTSTSVPDASLSSSTGTLKPQTVGRDFSVVLSVKAEDGTAGVDGVKVIVSLPVGLRPVSGSPAVGGCTVAGQQIVCDLGYLDYSRKVDVKVTAKPQRAGVHRITAVVLGDNDKDAVNNRASVAVTVLGVCCNGKNVKSTATEARCAALKGRFLPTRSLQQVDCKIPTGACCRPDGDCSIESKAMCATLRGRWSRNGVCSQSTCPSPVGACCSLVAGQCSMTTKAQCRGIWRRGADCSSTSCPAACISAFKPCNPDANSCCSGTVCSPIPTPFPGSSVMHACQPLNICSSAGQTCGPGDGSVGAACCAGLTCNWDFAFRSGTCQQPAPGECVTAGLSCADDSECCRGHRCGGDGLCRVVQCDRSCSTPECEADRKIDCSYQQYAIAAASAESVAPPTPSSPSPAAATDTSASPAP